MTKPLAILILCALAASPCGAQAPAAPDRTVLPIAPAPFRGTIREGLEGSSLEARPVVGAPSGAPNVLVVLIDDAGYGQTSTFGGLVPTPTLDRLADAGLRYTRFHVTAMCSPTRAALLTGRNPHRVGMGIIEDSEAVDSWPDSPTWSHIPIWDSEPVTPVPPPNRLPVPTPIAFTAWRASAPGPPREAAPCRTFLPWSPKPWTCGAAFGQKWKQ